MSAPPGAQVSIVDYGGSNILSVARALRHCGADVVLADTAAAIESAARLVLPGVGAFGDVRTSLARRDLIAPLQSFAGTGKPFLGICVGMQLMMDYSEEFGRHPGLGLIPGGVKPITSVGKDGKPHRIPHVGWQELARPHHDHSWTGTILEGLTSSEAVYFVHSFAAEPIDEAHRLADYHYDGVSVCAAIGHGTLVGCQFHPEKSGVVGLRILRKFLGTDKTRRIINPS